MEDKPGFLDKVRSKVISRKFLVWVTATVSLCIGVLASEHWVAVSLAYIGIEGLADIATRFMAGRTSK